MTELQKESYVKNHKYHLNICVLTFKY